MTENGGKQALRILAGQGEGVGMAHAGGFELDEHFALPGAVQLNRRHLQGRARLHRHRRFDVHTARLSDFC